MFIWCTKNLTSKGRKSLRINLEYDYAILIRWSPDGKAFILHKSIQNIIEVYKVTKKIDGFIGAATKVLEFPQVIIVVDGFRASNKIFYDYFVKRQANNL